MRASLVFRILFVAAIALVLAGILLPVGNGPSPESGRKSGARSMAGSLITALKAYRTDYGHFPAVRADGRYETAADNAKLLNVLRALDATDNTKKVTYFEAKDARSSKSPRSGFGPQGALFDPWGNPYRIRVAADNGDKVENPYKDSDQPTLPTSVIVWSVGKDGIQGSAEARDILKATCDDVVSWQ